MPAIGRRRAMIKMQLSPMEHMQKGASHEKEDGEIRDAARQLVS